MFGSGGDETLQVGTLSQFTSLISGFGTGDVIELPSLEASSLSYSKGTLTLFDASQNVVGTLTFAGKFSKADFTLKQYGKTGTELVFAGATAAAQPPPDFLSETSMAAYFHSSLDTGVPAELGGAVNIEPAIPEIAHSWHGLITSAG